MRLFLSLLLMGAVIAPAWADQPVNDPEAVRNPFESSMDETVIANPKLVQTNQPRSGDEPVLQGVAISEGKAAAIINGVKYNQGEIRGGIEVIEVRKREVDINWNGSPMTIQMNRQGAKTKRQAAQPVTNSYVSSNLPQYYGQSSMGIPDPGYPRREES